MSNFSDAVKAMLAAEMLVCPACGETNVPTHQAPTLERQPNGDIFCNNCSYTWKPEKK